MSKLYSHGCSTVAAGRDKYAGHVLSKLADKERYPGPQVEGWACRCHRNLIKILLFQNPGSPRKGKSIKVEKVIQIGF